MEGFREGCALSSPWVWRALMLSTSPCKWCACMLSNIGTSKVECALPLSTLTSELLPELFSSRMMKVLFIFKLGLSRNAWEKVVELLSVPQQKEEWTRSPSSTRDLSLVEI